MVAGLVRGHALEYLELGAMPDGGGGASTSSW